jgi:hypothetical protein
MSKCHHHRDRCREPRRDREDDFRETMPMRPPARIPIQGSCVMTHRGPICVMMPRDCRMR